MSNIDKLFTALVEEAAAEAEKRVLEQMQSLAPNRVLSTKEAAEYLGISDKLLYRLCSEKRIRHIPAGKKGSKRPVILFRQSTLDAWLREQEESSVS